MSFGHGWTALRHRRHGPGDAPRWDQVGVVRYPSRRALIDVQFDPARLEAPRDHREVAIEDTYTMILRPTIDRLAEPVAEA